MAELLAVVSLGALCLAFYWWGRAHGFKEGAREARARGRTFTADVGAGITVTMTERSAQAVIQSFGFTAIRTEQRPPGRKFQ